MRRIAVTSRLSIDEATRETRDCLDVQWAAFLGACGLTPLPVPSGVVPAEWLGAVGGVDGVLLTGGNDVVQVDPGPLNQRRQAFEEALLAAAPGVPVLGVCRGCQLLGARDGFDVAPVEGHVRATHALTHVGGGARWARFDGALVNSYHRYALAGAGRALEVTLRAADGTPEALCDASGRVAGLMWHPERETPWRPADVALFQEHFR